MLKRAASKQTTESTFASLSSRREGKQRQNRWWWDAEDFWHRSQRVRCNSCSRTLSFWLKFKSLQQLKKFCWKRSGVYDFFWTQSRMGYSASNTRLNPILNVLCVKKYFCIITVLSELERAEGAPHAFCMAGKMIVISIHWKIGWWCAVAVGAKACFIDRWHNVMVAPISAFRWKLCRWLMAATSEMSSIFSPNTH